MPTLYRMHINYSFKKQKHRIYLQGRYQNVVCVESPPHTCLWTPAVGLFCMPLSRASFVPQFGQFSEEKRPLSLLVLNFPLMNNVFIVRSCGRVSQCFQSRLTFTRLCWNEAESRARLGYRQLRGISCVAQRTDGETSVMLACLGGCIRRLYNGDGMNTHWHLWNSGWNDLIVETSFKSCLLELFWIDDIFRFNLNPDCLVVEKVAVLNLFETTKP